MLHKLLQELGEAWIVYVIQAQILAMSLTGRIGIGESVGGEGWMGREEIRARLLRGASSSPIPRECFMCGSEKLHAGMAQQGGLWRAFLCADCYPHMVISSWQGVFRELGEDNGLEVLLLRGRCQLCCTRGGFRAQGGQEAKRRIFCAVHKSRDAMDYRNPRCSSSGCQRVASWGRWQGRRERCRLHKIDKDVYLRTYNKSDPRSYPRCNAVGGCNKTASWGDIDGGGLRTDKPKYCSLHKREGQIDIRHGLCQNPSGCTTQPVFGCPSERIRRFCKKHRRAGDVNLMRPK
mmetsp:Transcript_52697/g.163521  ORF Transcript_52697/g.163521 Transcript_52697/m.163521 type:complete len:291 (-) Transcript_52697:1793-2665(-)